MATDLDRFCTRLDSRQLIAAFGRLPAEQSLAIPCLGERQRQTLVSLVDFLTYRSARPVMGGVSTPVYQDFELCYDIPPDHQLWELARYLEKRIATAIKKAGLQGHDALQFNDLIAQNYPPGCQGITPHRDHARYRIVVAIFLLTGDGNFCTCDDRKGVGAKTIPAVAGDLLADDGTRTSRREARTAALCERGHPQKTYDRASLRRACNDHQGFART